MAEDSQARTAYLAPVGYEAELQDELARAGVTVALRHDRLLVTDAPRVDVAWVANVWPDVMELPVGSIADTARQLRAIQRGWAVYAPVHRGRAGLVTERLPHVSARPLHLGEDAPSAPLGSWTFLTPGTVLASAGSTSPFPNGEARLVEDHEGPPSRAYLKLWEAVVVHLRRQVRPGERCIDLGASPGGWTWYLAQRGASVLAVDRAPLAPAVAARPGVEWRRGDAFLLDPSSVPPVEWLVSDVIAYPERVLDLVQRWQASGRVRTIVATVKFQGSTDHAVAQRFRALPGAEVVHLHHNKHELTVTTPGMPAR